MIDGTLEAEIDEYIDGVWEDIVADIGSLVAIRSVEDAQAASLGAPFGPEPRKALDCALGIARKLGLATHDCEGYLGFAELTGASAKQIATIAHTDIVPEGLGWSTNPFTLERKDGFLLGRGVLDDKGPCVLSLYAAHFFARRGALLPYTLRCLIGCNEETGMADVPYYLARFPEPDFLFTPDADFPACYAEKGHLGATFTSGPMADGKIVELDGGTVGNAIPGRATAVVRADAASLPAANGIDIEAHGDGCAELTAHGVGGHASRPEGTVNAIGMLVDYLLANGLCSEDERAFLQMEHTIFASTDGSSLGIAATDDVFDPLTCIGGTVRTVEGRFVQTIDSRYPTSTTGDRIAQVLAGLAEAHGCSLHVDDDMVPFSVDPASPEIQTLVASYRDCTGDAAEPFTIGGGTYARHFANAASFGPNLPDLQLPSWAGPEHGPNEGFPEEKLKQALKIYILAIERLMKLEF